MKIAFISKTYGKVFRGAETFVGELSLRLENSRILKNVGELTDEDVVIPIDGGWQAVKAKLWCLKNKKRIVISGQSGLGFDDRVNLLCFPDIFVCLSKWQQEWAKSRNPFVRTEIIPNGVNIEKFKPGKSKINFGLPGPVVLWVGAVDKMKRPELVIEAVAKTKYSLVIVGKGSREDDIASLGNKLLPGRFNLMSFSYVQMPDVYRAGDLFVFTTVPWESFGMVMLEAMATNLPIIASDDPIRREIIGDAGITVDVSDTDKLAAAITENLKMKWENAPRKRAEKFSWDQIARRYDDLFKSL
jgi:glycosyltransferase involved in cell wall biosynthesis